MEPILWIPLTVIFVVCLYAGRNLLVRRKLCCPHKDETAEVQVLCRALKPSKRLRIERCDLLADPKNVDCDQACLEQSA
jgi:hypothetical protein